VASDFNFNIKDVLEGLSNFENKARTAISLYCDTASKKLEAKAKMDASWTDRTGLSRKTIEGGRQWDGNKCVIYIAGNTPQFVYLELAHDKKYAVLQPTVDELAPSILRGMNNLLG
jgi:hypothetical protein